MPSPWILSLRYLLPLVACGIVLAYLLMGKRPFPFLRGLLAAVLLASALAAVRHYVDAQWRAGGYLNKYEFFHYYLGSKYAPELGYTHLYDAAVIAEVENNFRVKSPSLRNLETGAIISAQQVLAHPEQCKARFTPPRWAEFLRDVAFFHEGFDIKTWKRMLMDKGYNATPVWTMIAAPLSNRAPTDNLFRLTCTALIDALLLLLAIGCVAWAFDYRAALLMVIFLGVHYLFSHYTLKAAFLRLDWVVCLTMAVCMLKKGWYKTAGGLCAYAALARVFPLAFVFGVGAKFFFDLVRTRSIHHRYFGYFASFGCTVAVFVLASILYHGGVEIWREFFAKIAAHDRDISAWRVGFKYVFLMSYNGGAFWGTDLQQFFEHWKWLWWTIQVAVLLASAFLVQKLEDYEAMAFSYVPVFFLFAPTYYYHIMLLVPFLFFAGRMERPTHAAGLLFMFVTSAVSFKCYYLWNRGYKLFFIISCLLLAMVLYMMLLAFLDSLKKPAEVQQNSPGASA